MSIVKLNSGAPASPGSGEGSGMGGLVFLGLGLLAFFGLREMLKDKKEPEPETIKEEENKE